MERVLSLICLGVIVITLVIAGEISFYLDVSRQIAIPQSSQIISSQKKFTPLIINPFKWETLKNQSSDLFTPPSLFCDNKENWVLRNQSRQNVANCFGLELIEIKKKPYQLQLSGYVYLNEEDPPDLFLLDTDSQNIIQTKVGTNIPSYNLQVIAFNPPLENQSPSIEIQDNNLNKRVLLAFNQFASEFRYEAIFQNTQTGEKLALGTISSQLQLGNDQLWLRELDFENQAVTLERYSSNNESTQLQVLKAASSSFIDQLTVESPSEQTIVHSDV